MGSWTGTHVARLPSLAEVQHGRAQFQNGETAIETRTVTIASELDIALARREAGMLANRQELMLTEIDVASFVTAVSELANNVYVHAGGGTLVVALIRDVRGAAGVRATAHDTGPGIASFEHAMRDGVSTGGGLGAGLSGVARLVGNIELLSKLGEGTIATTVKRGRPTTIRNSAHPGEGAESACALGIKFGACVVPADGSLSCGDAHFQHFEGGLATLAVVDGLGHGAAAAVAARRAISYITKCVPVAPSRYAELFDELGHELDSTVGAAAAIATIDLINEKISFSGIGNVRGRVVGPREASFESVPGVLGDQHEPVQVDELEFRRGDLVIVYSDGVRVPRRLSSTLPPRIDPVRAAQEILKRYRNPADDALVLAAR